MFFALRYYGSGRVGITVPEGVGVGVGVVTVTIFTEVPVLPAVSVAFAVICKLPALAPFGTLHPSQTYLNPTRVLE